MKKHTFVSVGLLVLMLTIGGIAYGQGGMSGSSDQSGMGGSSGQSSSGSSYDQSGAGGTSGAGDSQSEMGGATGSAGQSGAGAPSSQQMQGQVDINTASARELQSVPGMTSTMAKNIVKYRDQNGPFASVDDLTKVKGVSEKKLNAMRDRLTVGTAGSQQQPMGGQGGTSGAPSDMGTGGTSGGAGGMGSEGTGGMDSGGTSGSTDDMGSGGTGSSGSQY